MVAREKPTVEEVLQALDMLWGCIDLETAKDFQKDFPELAELCHDAHCVVGHGEEWGVPCTGTD